MRRAGPASMNIGGYCMIGSRMIGVLVTCLLVLSAAAAQAGLPTEQLPGGRSTGW